MSKESEHTEGEWMQGVKQIKSILCAKKSGMYNIADMNIANKNWQNDIRVLAAAPDLLKVAIETKKLLDRLDFGKDHPLVIQTNKAIKKAGYE